MVVVDRSSVCGESTGASAGGLWPAHECLSLPSPALARAAADSHSRIREEFDCDYVRNGVLELLEDSETPLALDRIRRTTEAGFAAELLRDRELIDCEPALLHPGPAIRFSGDGSIHPLKLAAGITAWLRRSGVTVCLREEVTAVSTQPLSVHTRTSRISAGAVVIATGAWTPLLTELLGWSPPIRPVRGTLLATDSLAERSLRSVVIGLRYYYWQLAAGPVAGGGSEEDVGFREGVSTAVTGDIRAEWQTLFPTLRHIQFTSGWSGFRPFCRDMQPVVGRIPGFRDVFVSAGHFRRGILLAPLSGDLIAGEIGGGHRCNAADEFRPDRFPRGGQPRS